jgi:hypothetical protein
MWSDQTNRRGLPGTESGKRALEGALAGNPPGWGAEKVAALKVLRAFSGTLIGWMVAAGPGWDGLPFLAVIGLFAAIGGVLPGAMLDLKSRAGRTSSVGPCWTRWTF